MNELQQWTLRTCTGIVKALGTGHSEVVYHNAFLVDLRKTDHEWESEKTIPVVYKNIQVGTVKSDVVIGDKLVIEFKAVTRKLGDQDVRQTKKYMELCGIDQGLVINFSRIDTVNKSVEFLCI